MSSQNILNFYGSKLDLKIDSSELYDYEISKVVDDYNTDVLDLTRQIQYSTLKIDSNCLDDSLNNIKPWEIEINTGYTHDYTCDFTIKRRTEKGWTLNFIFNKENLSWSNGGTFYYWGIKDEIDPLNFLDNNLSFSFTSDGRILWKSFRYSGICDSSYIESAYLSSGQTPTLCTGGTISDFNITITFDRYKYLTDCDIENVGGWNDLIIGSSGNVEELNKKWADEKDSRLGILKIYLNGRPIYKLKDWEEVIPSKRTSVNPMVQVWGGGTNGCVDTHTGFTEFNLKRIQYIEEPLDFIHVRHHYLVSIKPYYDIKECVTDCVDDLSFYFSNGLLTDDGENILAENNNILLY